MRVTSFLSNASASCDRKAVAPAVFQESISLRADASEDGDGSAAVDLLPAIVAGNPAAYGGQVVNEGCATVLLDVTYLDGDDCNACSVDTLTPVVVQVTVKPDRAIDLPPGYVVQVQATSVDSTGTAVAVNANQEIEYQSCSQPCCNGSVLAV